MTTTTLVPSSDLAFDASYRMQKLREATLRVADTDGLKEEIASAPSMEVLLTIVDRIFNETMMPSERASDTWKLRGAINLAINERKG